MPTAPHDPRSDEELMALVRHDDTAALGTLYDRHASSALRVACAICPERPRAEDAVEEAFLRIWHRRTGARADDDFKALLMTTVQERAKDIQGGDGLPEALGALPESEAEVIVLALFGHLTHTEIATQLGLSSDTVKGRMRLGLTKVRAPAPFHCSFEAGGPGPARVRIEGELDLATLPQLKAALEAAAQEPGDLWIECERLTFLDCAGLGTIAAAAARATQSDRRLSLVGASGQVARLLDLTGVLAENRL